MILRLRGPTFRQSITNARCCQTAVICTSTSSDRNIISQTRREICKIAPEQNIIGIWRFTLRLIDMRMSCYCVVSCDWFHIEFWSVPRYVDWAVSLPANLKIFGSWNKQILTRFATLSSIWWNLLKSELIVSFEKHRFESNIATNQLTPIHLGFYDTQIWCKLAFRFSVDGHLSR